MSKLGEYIASQCGNPRGVVGKIMTWSMNRANRALYRGIVDELRISPRTKILDIGCGNGYLETLIVRKCRCLLTGIDISEDMVRKAARANRAHVAAGKMRFQLGDCCDAVTTINTIYFWNDAEKGMSEIRRVLKDGGIFYNAVYAREQLDKLFYTKSGFRKYTKDEYIKLGKKAGFQRIRIKRLGTSGGLLFMYYK